MGSTANFAALLVLPGGSAVASTTLACLLVELAVMRKPWLRATFNAASTALTVGASVAVLRAFSPQGVLALSDGWRFLALIAAAAVYYIVNRAIVTGVLALDGHLGLLAVWRGNFGMRRDALPSGAALSLGVLVADLYSHSGVAALVFVLLPAWIVFGAHRRMLTRGPGAVSEPETEPENVPLPRASGDWS
jgi:hypothetical protein